jgi:hypothetical protein
MLIEAKKRIMSSWNMNTWNSIWFMSFMTLLTLVG